MDEIILRNISKEIENKYNCKVVLIRYVQLLSLCVTFKVVFTDDFIYKPLDNLPKPETVCFSEHSMIFTKRVDLFECVKLTLNLN